MEMALKIHLMLSYCLQNPLVYVMPLEIQRYFLKLEINTKLIFQLLVQNLIIFGLQYPTDATTVVATPCCLLLGLSLPIMWVTDEIENIEHEPLGLLGASNKNCPVESDDIKEAHILIKREDSELKIEPSGCYVAHTVLEMNYTKQQLIAAVMSKGLRPTLAGLEWGAQDNVPETLNRILQDL
ncbi:hypothetical protein AAG906_038484 [Vitis piasezkii]